MPSAPPARCFQLPAGTDHARELVGGVLIDPALPWHFACAPNANRGSFPTVTAAIEVARTGPKY